MLTKQIVIIDSCSHDTTVQLREILESNLDCEIYVAKTAADIAGNRRYDPDLLFCISDDNIENSRKFLEATPGVPGVMVYCDGAGSRRADLTQVAGFDDFIVSPLRAPEVILRVGRLISGVSPEEKEAAKENILQKHGISQLIGQDPVFIDKISRIPQIADCDATILIVGKTGVGKELFARAIHYLSNRSKQAFVPVNCGAIPTTLVENELFGHRRGAYTDAQQNHVGIVSEAEKGTLFLDEIDALPLEAQSKILRLIQDKTYRPLGHNKHVEADIRVVAATNADLAEKIRLEQFREDLFYRFTITLELPTLKERPSDIPVLTDYFLKKFVTKHNRRQKTFSKAAIQKLMLYHWPGNVRELENIVQQAILLSPGHVISPDYINIPVAGTGTHKLSFNEAKRRAVETFEKEYVKSLLINHDGNITKAAREARKDRGDFSKLVKKLDLGRKDG